MNDLLIDGSRFDDDGFCYVGIFNNNGAQNTEHWYVGTNFMKDYYTIYDMSGLDYGDQKLRIAMGLRKTKNDIGAMRYDPRNSFYQPSASDMSEWTFNPNKYTMAMDLFKTFIKNNLVLFIGCISLLGALVITVIGLCIYLRRMSHQNKQEFMLKESMAQKKQRFEYYGQALNQNDTGDNLEVDSSLENSVDQAEV